MYVSRSRLFIFISSPLDSFCCAFEERVLRRSDCLIDTSGEEDGARPMSIIRTLEEGLWDFMADLV